jgi:hypothetical protein
MESLENDKEFKKVILAYIILGIIMIFILVSYGVFVDVIGNILFPNLWNKSFTFLWLISNLLFLIFLIDKRKVKI